MRRDSNQDTTIFHRMRREAVHVPKETRHCAINHLFNSINCDQIELVPELSRYMPKRQENALTGTGDNKVMKSGS
jgi:hypothetical protein